MSLTRMKTLRVAVVVTASAGVLLLLSGCGGGCRGLKTDSSACVSHPRLFAIYYLAIDRRHPQTVYVASADSTVDKSTNGGAGWHGLEPTKEGWGVTAGAVLDPRRPDSVYVGTADGVYKSADGGASWVSAGLHERCGNSPVLYNACEIDALAVVPGGRVLYAGLSSGCFGCGYSGPGLFKSTNGGSSWVPVGFNGQTVSSLALDPRMPATIYAVPESKDPPLKSTDGGTSWRRIHGLPNDVGFLAIDPRQPQAVYASASDGVFTSTDGGLMWHHSGPGDATDFAFGPKAVYAATTNGVFRSTNQGRTWRHLGPIDKTVDAIAVSANGRVLYAGTDNGSVYRFRLHG